MYFVFLYYHKQIKIYPKTIQLNFFCILRLSCMHYNFETIWHFFMFYYQVIICFDPIIAFYFFIIGFCFSSNKHSFDICIKKKKQNKFHQNKRCHYSLPKIHKRKQKTRHYNWYFTKIIEKINLYRWAQQFTAERRKINVMTKCFNTRKYFNIKLKKIHVF